MATCVFFVHCETIPLQEPRDSKAGRKDCLTEGTVRTQSVDTRVSLSKHSLPLSLHRLYTCEADVEKASTAIEAYR